MAILPYYVANLNIEATYQAITGQFAEFENLCFVDTLDNVDALGIHSGHQFDLLGGLADENMERVKRQNRRKISVIIGNPPYNANQQNENDNNKNRTYAHIDARIKNTYIKASTAQKTKLYDMYVRFFRWASDRIGDEGVVAFITNRSFIDAHTADGFRRIVSEDFSEAWIVDLGGDYKKQGVGGSGNVFGIGTGVAVSFWVKRRGNRAPARLAYLAAPSGSAEEKLTWVSTHDLSTARSQVLSDRPDAAWIDIPEAETSALIPLVDKKNKLKDGSRDRAIFKLFSLGVATNRDDWVYDRNTLTLAKKVRFFVNAFNREHRRWRREGMPNRTGDWVDRSIKWTSELEAYLKQPKRLHSSRKLKRCALYRPFTKVVTHFAPIISHRPYQQHRFFPFGTEVPNPYLAMTGPGSQKPWMSLASDVVPDLHLVGAGAGTNVLPRYRYTKSGERVDNITDWALNKFVAHYGKKGVSKDAIFHYVYAVLHDPIYRETYALNLKREFPRIPFYPDFARWVAWGQALMAMHIGYEEVEPWPIERIDTPNPKRAEGTHPKPILKSVPEQGLVRVDEDTQITGIPREAWNYRLGNRSAIDWVLDQHKEKTPRDPTIREKFNTYRFADYKESMIALLAKVVRVSIDTVAITEAMRSLDRSAWER
ncbi:type ISP restriction/modification enzyme [Sphingomonas sp.]|uniref:type ISP restriction/modification enzyme n=1 Tax=Sphingomonas sp. TaxID=28214 RepID=UPI002DE9E9D6|nr:type ISP restriction/modification enzyme [Sphingomonas sp.]